MKFGFISLDILLNHLFASPHVLLGYFCWTLLMLFSGVFLWVFARHLGASVWLIYGLVPLVCFCSCNIMA